MTLSGFKGMSSSFGSEEELAVKTLFPYGSKFQMLQMLTELNPNEVNPFSVLGVVRRRWNSEVLKMYEEEFRINRKSKDRKGILEMAEIFSAGRRLASDEED